MASPSSLSSPIFLFFLVCSSFRGSSLIFPYCFSLSLSLISNFHLSSSIFLFSSPLFPFSFPLPSHILSIPVNHLSFLSPLTNSSLSFLLSLPFIFASLIFLFSLLFQFSIPLLFHIFSIFVIHLSSSSSLTNSSLPFLVLIFTANLILPSPNLQPIKQYN